MKSILKEHALLNKTKGLDETILSDTIYTTSSLTRSCPVTAHAYGSFNMIMDGFVKQKLTAFQAVTLASSLAGVCITLYFVYARLRFFYGVDYHLYYTWYQNWKNTGVFYPEDTVFFNVPLAVIAFGFYSGLPIKAAVMCKFIQTAALSVFCVALVFRMYPGLIRDNGAARFSLMWIGIVFVSTQWYYLNIYVETALCLVLSLYFLDRGKLWPSAFFLGLAVVFKIFLLPLVLAPLITRKFRLFAYILCCLGLLGIVSLVLFGWDTHMEMLRAMAGTYGRMRVHGISYPVVSDGFAGWQDLFNKLVKTDLIAQGMVKPLTLTMGMLYGCLCCYVIGLMAVKGESRLNNPGFYANVFSSLLILSLGFNFRFDHGVLFLPAIFFLTTLGNVYGNRLTAVCFVLSLSGLLLNQGLTALGLISMAQGLSSVFYVVSFQFMAINLLVLLVAVYWAGLERNPSET